MVLLLAGNYLNTYWLFYSMNEEKLDILTEAEYSRIKTSKYDLQILKNPPPVILTYDDTEHFEPPEVTDYFCANPDEPGLLHSDGYLYQNNFGMNGYFYRMSI